MDLISRRDAIEALCSDCQGRCIPCDSYPCSEVEAINALPTAQPEPLVKESRTLVKDLVKDTISRQAAIDALMEIMDRPNHADFLYTDEICKTLNALPSARPTLCGYDIEHLILIANVLRKENLPPERITDVITDIGRIVSIVRDEFEETLRKAVEQCEI